MKRIFYAVLLLSATAGAQTKQGVVVYEQKINMWKRMPPEAEQFKAMVPEYQTNKMELQFNATQSLYKPVKETEDQMPEPGGGGGGGFRMRFGGGGNAETYRDYENGTSTESRELGPKKYLIDDSLRSLKWKLEEDTMTINGYLCKKATTTFSMQQFGGQMRRFGGNAAAAGIDTNAIKKQMAEVRPVTAWYAEQFETQAGPETYFGLPGLIMKVDVDNGFMVYSALSVTADDKLTVKAPTSGKKITRDEYRKMQEEQMQNMRGMMGPGGPGGGGQRMIITN